MLRLTLAVLVATLTGCTSAVRFGPPIETRQEADELVFAFDMDGDGTPDYWTFADQSGRRRSIAYANADGSRGPRIILDDIAAASVPHLVIALDGVPFDLVQQLYDEGHFRFFRPPSRVICCYPGMTDLAMAELMHAGPCLAYQAVYFDRVAGRMSDGNKIYLDGANSPWLAKMDYRCSLWWDVKVYLDPRSVFEHELAGMIETFASIDNNRSAFAYSVGTAGLGTRGGREAILGYLGTIDRMCEQIIHDRRGRVKITVTADHGHNLVRNERIKLDNVLKTGGYRVTTRLRDANDVIPIEYGLVTYAALYTDDPVGVARCVLNHEAVEFASYAQDDKVFVVDRQGTARIEHRPNGFAYITESADPLYLTPIIENLCAAGHVAPDGTIDDQAFFDATTAHEYPDALSRLWRAFYALVDNPPDVIANLRDGTCHGSGFFNALVGGMDSTHGSLNRINSATFTLTMLGELPPALRTRDLLPALEQLRK